MSLESRVDRFLELERRASTTHALMTNIFMTEATAALDVLVFKRVCMHVVFKKINSYNNHLYSLHTSTTQGVVLVAVIHHMTLKSSQNISQHVL